MKSTGVIRKIDELGRIVIPKEIRSVLGIKTGDDISFLVEEDKIILEKFHKMDTLKDVSNSLINSVIDLTDGSVYLTNKERILTSGEYENKLLPTVLTKLLSERQTYTSTISEVLKFEEQILEGYFLIYPVIEESNPIGLILLVKKEPITKEDELFLKLLKNIIENK